MKKSTNSKRMKTKSPSPSATADQDIVGLLTTLVQKLTTFETKIDMVLSRIPSQPFVVPRPQPTTVSLTQRQREPRPMYEVICSDCGKDSSVPFKPSGDRPVYCKECFSIRKNKGSMPRGDGRPKERPPVQVRLTEKPKVVKPAKPVKKKKIAQKKKKPIKKKKAASAGRKKRA